MKKIFNYLSIILLSVITLYSCDEDLEKNVTAPLDNGTFLITPSVDNIVLTKANADTRTAITFTWDNAATLYGIDTPAKFEIQMDALSGDFSASVGTEVTDTLKNYTDAEMNAIALNLKLTPEAVGKIKVRLKATLAHGASPIYSVVDTISVTPYVDYTMPAELYLTGDATTAGWDNYPLPSQQKMTKIDDSKFELVIALKATGKFAFITSANNWTDPAYKAATDSEPLLGGNFIASGSANSWGGKEIGVLWDGEYKITLDFKTKKYDIVLIPPAELYLQGSAVPSNWGGYPLGPEQKLTKINDHTFQLLNIELTAGDLAFITSKDNWTDPAYKAITDTEPLSDGNFVEVGTNNPTGYDIHIPINGTYNITVDFETRKYNIVLLPPAELYLQGSAVASNWGYPIPPTQKMTKINDHTFQLLNVGLAAGVLAFITSQDHWTDPVYKAATDTEPLSDGNFVEVGTNNPIGYDIQIPTGGIYNITVDFETKKYAITFPPPTDLYIIGDATPLDWGTPNSSQKFTKIDTHRFSITLPLEASGQFAFITTPTTWSDPAYIAKTSAEPLLGGEFIPSGSLNSNAGFNITAPALAGTYTIIVDFTNGTYTLSN